MIKITTPYCSQYTDVKDLSWQPRACGMASLKMLLGSRGVLTPSIDEMIAQGDAIGAYGESGWKHEGLIQLAKQYGANLSRAEWRQSTTETPGELNEKGIEFLHKELRAGHAVIVSAVKKFKEDDKFHMVVLVGFEEDDGDVTGFYYHDADAYTEEEGKELFVPIDIFSAKWRKMAIF